MTIAAAPTMASSTNAITKGTYIARTTSYAATTPFAIIAADITTSTTPLLLV